MDKEEVCIIQHADQNNNVKVQNSTAYFAEVNGSIQSKSMNPINVINKNHQPTFIHPVESQNSVIQQTKDVKSFNQPLNLYELDPPTNALGYLEQANSSFDHSNLQAVQFLKSFQTNGQLPERSMLNTNCSNSSIDSANQLNATFYVVDSNGKVNLIDAQNQSPFTNSISSQKSNESDIQLMNVLGSDLPSLKKFPEIQSFPTVNYPPENIPLPSSNPALISDNYFSSYPTPSVSGNPLSNQIISKNAAFSSSAAAISSQSVQSTQLPQAVQATLPQIQNQIPLGKIRSGLLSSDVPVTYTRGRKRSKRGPFICSECRKEFSNQSTLTKHMITHSDERKFVCHQCSKAFKRHDHLNGHMLTHREHKPYACDIEGCDKSYCDARSLRRHKEKHKENELQCSEAISLSQKLPCLNVSDKASNIFMPINASVQLQYLAFQQQKTQNESTNHDQPNSLFPKVNSDKEHLLNSNSVNNLKPDKVSLNKPAHNDTSATPFANENALLHQLLTNQDKNIFKPQPINPFSSNHNSTVIKINDSYGSYDTSVSTNSKLFDKKQELNYISQPDIEPGTSKLTNASLSEKTILQENLDNNDLVECSICQKKFKSLSSLNGHMRLHGGYFKLNYLLNSDSDTGTDKDLEEDSQLSSSNVCMTKDDNLNITNINCSLPYSQKNFDIINKDNYIYDDHHADQSKDNEFEEINLFDKDNEMVYGHNLNRQIVQNDVPINEFKMPLNYVSHVDKLNLIESSNLYNHQMYVEKERDNNLIINNSQCSSTNLEANDRPKELNEVMFSPITPVTPLKNNSHFTFDFSANKQIENKIDSLSCKQSEQLHFQTTIENDMVADNYCFETTKDNILLEKEEIDMPSIDIDDTQSNFNGLNNSQIKNFECEASIDKNMDSMEAPHNEFFDNKPDTFNDFDLPSCKLTSDLYNRRLRKNMDDSNRTRELLSIKQIAASLQSFSQSFERSHSHHHNVSSNQQLNHSYSVPTTPVVQDNRFANNADSYQAANLSHHSLPTTPIESSSHFTFNVPDSCHQTASPTTPVVQQQFNFAIPAANHQQPNEVLNSRHFDLSCLNESQYPSEYIYNSKDLDSDFIDNDNFKQPNLVEYETANSGNHIPDAISHAQNVNIFPQNEPSNYHRTQMCIGEQFANSSKNNKQESTLTNYNETDRFALSNSNVNLNHMSDKKQSNTVMSNFNSSHNGESVGKKVDNAESEQVKDINSNYITLCDNSNVVLTLSVDNETNDCDNAANDSSNKLISSVKTLLRKHVLPSSTLPMATPFKKKKPRPEPLYIPPHVNTFVYHSRLRSPRFWNMLTAEASNISPPPYTPPPMLSPVRSGPGLFWKITNSHSSQILPRLSNYNSSKLINNKKITYDYDVKDLKTPTTAYEPYEYVIPQADVQPHVNIGHNFQARIPAFNYDRKEIRFKADKDDMIWNPSVLDNVPSDRLNLYLKVSNSTCVPGSGNNKEYALHLLHMCDGDVLEALAKLVKPKQVIEEEHPLADYYYADNDSWNQEEILVFQKSLLKHDKDFYLISREVASKSVKQCVEFYYLWKKNCPEIVRRLRFIRRKRDHESRSALFVNIPSSESNAKCDTSGSGNVNTTNGSCANLDDKLSNDTDSNSCGQSNAPKSSTHGYPCRKCGRIFKRLKSRSAHMKIHAND